MTMQLFLSIVDQDWNLISHSSTKVFLPCHCDDCDGFRDSIFVYNKIQSNIHGTVIRILAGTCKVISRKVFPIWDTTLAQEQKQKPQSDNGETAAATTTTSLTRNIGTRCI
jgi:hypothetical protein